MDSWTSCAGMSINVAAAALVLINSTSWLHTIQLSNFLFLSLSLRSSSHSQWTQLTTVTHRKLMIQNTDNAMFTVVLCIRIHPLSPIRIARFSRSLSTDFRIYAGACLIILSVVVGFRLPCIPTTVLHAVHFSHYCLFQACFSFCRSLSLFIWTLRSAHLLGTS